LGRGEGLLDLDRSDDARFQAAFVNSRVADGEGHQAPLTGL
jgi:hypothetical protein